MLLFILNGKIPVLISLKPAILKNIHHEYVYMYHIKVQILLFNFTSGVAGGIGSLHMILLLYLILYSLTCLTANK